jgi:uncharacterized Zn finger protein
LTGVEAKAARLLVGGSVAILEMCTGHVLARVEGDHGVYDVTNDGWRWRCECPAFGPCSHAIAITKVVRPRGEAR